MQKDRSYKEALQSRVHQLMTPSPSHKMEAPPKDIGSAAHQGPSLTSRMAANGSAIKAKKKSAQKIKAALAFMDTLDSDQEEVRTQVQQHVERSRMVARGNLELSSEALKESVRALAEAQLRNERTAEHAAKAQSLADRAKQQLAYAQEEVDWIRAKRDSLRARD